MTGWHEIRFTGPGREQFRLFCLLETVTTMNCCNAGWSGRRSPSSPACATLADDPLRADYNRIRQLRDEHKGNHPRGMAT